MMTWNFTDLERRNALQRENPGQVEAPEIPAFPAGKATFIVDSGNPNQQTLASIQSLHDLYNNEYERLKVAYEGRERAQRLREAELKANPPKPKDIIINYWRAVPKSQISEKGTAR